MHASRHRHLYLSNNDELSCVPLTMQAFEALDTSDGISRQNLCEESALEEGAGAGQGVESLCLLVSSSCSFLRQVKVSSRLVSASLCLFVL